MVLSNWVCPIAVSQFKVPQNPDPLKSWFAQIWVFESGFPQSRFCCIVVFPNLVFVKSWFCKSRSKLCQIGISRIVVCSIHISPNHGFVELGFCPIRVLPNCSFSIQGSAKSRSPQIVVCSNQGFRIGISQNKFCQSGFRQIKVL